MDPSAFDTLVRSFARGSTRRRLVALLAALPVGGVLTRFGVDEATAELPHQRLGQRTEQRNRKQRTRRRRNKNQNQNNGNTNQNNPNGGGGGDGGTGGGGGGRLGDPGPCLPTGSSCTQGSQCCGGNCFNLVCAATVSQCGGVNCPAGATGCCRGTCCQAPATQCNPAGLCCAPNCAHRECGPDGCGRGGTCGSCPGGQPCNTQTGQCPGPPPCSAQTCPNGCCDAAGTCRVNDAAACGTGGAACRVCPSAPPNATVTCAGGTCGFTCDFVSCQGGCCPSGQNCFPDGCCTAIYDPCTDDSQCCSFPRSTCKRVGFRGFCCGVSNVSPCQTGADCCSGVCTSASLTCA